MSYNLSCMAVNTITSVCDQLLFGDCSKHPQFGQNVPEEMKGYQIGLAFMVEIDVESHGYQGDTFIEDWVARKRIFLLYVITEHHNVFVAEIEPTLFLGKRDMEKIPPSKFQNTSNHDSCWRSDGLNGIWRASCDAYEHVYSRRPAEVRPSMDEANIDISLGFNVTQNDLYRYVLVKHESTLDHRRKITKLIPCNSQCTLTLAFPSLEKMEEET